MLDNHDVSATPQARFPAGTWPFLCAILGVSIYRACTQSLTHDEAWNWQLVLRGGFSDLFATYQANHHVLHSVAMWLSTQAFGASEWSMRLPAVAAGFVLTVQVARLLARLTSSAWLFRLGLAATLLNPLVADFLVAARGYSLGLALLFTVVLRAIDRLREPERPGLVRRLSQVDGYLLGACLATLPSLLFPVAALLAAFVLVAARSAARPFLGAFVRSAASVVAGVVLPASVVVGALFLPLLAHMSRGNFHYGVASASAALECLVATSLTHNPGICPPIMRIVADPLRPVAEAAVVLLLAGCAALAAFDFARSRVMRDSPVVRCTLLSSGFVLLTLLATWAGAVVAGLPWPLDRTALHIFVALPPAAVALTERLRETRALHRGVKIAIGSALAVATVVFALQFNLTHFPTWRFDADSRRVFESLERIIGTRPADRPATVGTYFLTEPALNVYREWRQADWMAPIVKEMRPMAVYDYYVVMAGRDEAMVADHLEIIERFELSQVAIARPK